MIQKSILIQGVYIQYFISDTFNPSTALVFLHGWGSQATCFRKTLEQCKNFVAMDLPGFGGSEVPKTTWSLDEYASCVSSFLKKLCIENPILIGHSFGGSIALKYCVRGGAVKKLVLVGSAGIRRRKTIQQGLYFLIAKASKFFFLLPGLRAMKSSVRKWFYRKIDSEDYICAGAMTDIYKKIISEDLSADLAEIHVPTALIWGKNDKETPLSDGEYMHQHIGGSKLFVIENAGHYVFVDNQEDFEKVFFVVLKDV